MDEVKFCKRINALHKRILKEMNKSTSPKKCNEHVEDLELIKKELYDNDYEWIYNYETVYEVSEPGFFSDGADETEIHETLEEAANQLDRMLGYMGYDMAEILERPDVKQPSKSISPININFSPNMTQHVESSADATVNIEIKQEVERLAKEFEKESKRMFPNRSRLEKIIETLKTLGPYAAPYVKQFTDMLGKLW
jgi:hypothetical protein